jgi:hypothetical protein
MENLNLEMEKLNSSVLSNISLYNSLMDNLANSRSALKKISQLNLSNDACSELNIAIADFNEAAEKFTMKSALSEKQILINALSLKIKKLSKKMLVGQITNLGGKLPVVGQKIVYAAFLYTHGCIHCEGVKKKLTEWAPDFPDLRIGTFDMTKAENKKMGEALFDMYRIPEAQRGDIVKFYIGEDYLSGDNFRYEDVKSLVSKYQGKAAPPPWEKVDRETLKNGEQKIVERFKRFSLSAVLAAGFIDGINPCAFATIIFLVSYLTMLGKKSREILMYGIKQLTILYRMQS